LLVLLVWTPRAYSLNKTGKHLISLLMIISR